VLTVNRLLRINVGEELLIRCDAEAVPPATFVEIRRRNGLERVLRTVNGTGSQTLSVVYRLRNLTLGNSGVYVCVASNSEGETEVNFTLLVQGRWALFGKAYDHDAVNLLVHVAFVIHLFSGSLCTLCPRFLCLVPQHTPRNEGSYLVVVWK